MNTLLGYHSVIEQVVFAVVSILWVTSYDTQLNSRSSQTEKSKRINENFIKGNIMNSLRFLYSNE